MVVVALRESRGRSRWRRAGFKESSLSEVAHDEGHGHQGDADAGRGEELVDGVGQDEGARPRRHLGADHGLAEAHFAEHGRHVHSAGGRGDNNQHQSKEDANSFLTFSYWY